MTDEFCAAAQIFPVSFLLPWLGLDFSRGREQTGFGKPSRKKSLNQSKHEIALLPELSFLPQYFWVCYMGGLALMVNSPKKWEFPPLLYVHIGDYSTTFEVFTWFHLNYRWKQVIICKNMIKKSLHSNIQTFFNFELKIFKMSYFIN